MTSGPRLNQGDPIPCLTFANPEGRQFGSSPNCDLGTVTSNRNLDGHGTSTEMLAFIVAGDSS